MNNISVSCGEMERVVYKLPSDLLNLTLNGVCEQSWHSEDGRLIADPSDPHRLSDPAISVSSDRLVTSRCVNLLHEILCDASGSHHSLQTMFIVRNETAATPNSDVNEVTPSLQISDQLWWLFPLFIFIFIFICFILRRRIFRKLMGWRSGLNGEISLNR